MKIIQIIDNLSMGGGVNSFVFDLCYALKEGGCDVSLIGILGVGYNNNREISKLKEKGIRVECLYASSKKNALLKHVFHLRNKIVSISNGEETICNLHLKLSVLMGVVACMGIENIKCVETYHNTYHNYYLQYLLCSPFIKKYFCVSKAATEEMHRRFNTPYEKLVTVQNGVSRKRIREMAGLEKYQKTVGEIRVVSVGRLSNEKNFIVPIRAFVNMCNEKLTYTLVGSGVEEKEINAIASKNKYICMTGALSRVEALRVLSSADIVVMPSLWEGRSILQLEAMALDKPMMISDAEGLREPFGEKALEKDEDFRVCQFGYLVKTDNPRAYMYALEHFIDHETKMRQVSEYIKKISLDNDISQVALKYIYGYKSIEE